MFVLYDFYETRNLCASSRRRRRRMHIGDGRDFRLIIRHEIRRRKIASTPTEALILAPDR